ncbi:Hemolysin III [Pseudomonas syringae pv. papulans]|jgi:hemolysin III|nr:Hemolysin III [Pseudomonas syringae pv. papulans]RMN41666.1 Hemolysin III [Pseudomonas syringae pv. papulans]RMS71170.1 Hemolysin III [Pseudomonas syringae pv. aceris]RMV50308.1 Hemolysin III [Pseudomonas syringae pv. papulans]
MGVAVCFNNPESLFPVFSPQEGIERMYYGEKFNAWSHLVGAVLAAVGAIWLLVMASLHGDVWKVVSMAIYGACLVTLYSVSTVYHSVKGRSKSIMQKVDHFSIYLMIAGSYTPFCLVTLRGAWGWTLFGIVWGLALIGILQEIKPRSEARIMSIVIYAVMGWIVLVAVKPLLAALGVSGFIWLAGGGVLYTVGILFFAYDQIRHFHGIWHLFVIGGSLMHFVAICFYVL